MSEASLRRGYFDYLNAVTLHTIFIGLGVLFSYLVFNRGVVPHRNYKYSYREWFSLNKHGFEYLVFAFVVLVFFHQILSLGSVPFFLLFTDSSVSELTMAREGGYKLQGGMAVYFWHFSRMIFVPLIVCSSFINFIINKSKFNLLFFICVLFVGVLNNALSGAKAPVAMLFLCLFISFVLIKGRVDAKYVFFAVILVFVFPFIVEYSFSENGFFETLSIFSLKVINRFSYETFDRTLSYFDVFPYNMDYLGGRTNSLFMAFSGKDYFNVQNYIFLNRLGGEVPEHLLHGSANAHFIGYMNADFGLLGVALSCFIVGAIIGFVDVKSSNKLKSPVTLSLYIVMGFIFWKLMGSQPTSVLFSHGAIPAFFLLLFFYYFKHFNNKRECQ
ncbi:O-antigen polymerase [Shewanella algae]|uniref:O-antigen polymerase n=1 Tax=Shewanella algae TaxID=38313 RepID=UPI0016457A8C|nr:O-antigen polymerase [Shewanella algae]